jgi:hypothetical protein
MYLVKDLNLNRDVLDDGTTELPSQFWFTLHKLLGDVYFASGRADDIELQVARAREAGLELLSDDNFLLFHLKLQEAEVCEKEEEEKKNDAEKESPLPIPMDDREKDAAIVLSVYNNFPREDLGLGM